MPVFNGEEYIAESLESALNQVKCNLEVIVCDDVSSDRTFEICESFKDARVRLVQNPFNMGLARNLNRCIELSSGKYLRFLCQDDVILPKSCELLSQRLDDNPEIGMVFSAAETIGPDGLAIPKSREFMEQQDGVPDLMHNKTALKFFWERGCIPGNLSTVMIRRSVLDEVGLFNENMIHALDWELWVRIAERASVGFLRDSLCKIRHHTSRLSHKNALNIRSIKENYAILRRLAMALDIGWESSSSRYLDQHYSARFFHSALRALFRGNLILTKEILGVIVKNRSLTASSYYWLLSLPDRIRRKKL